MELHDIEKLLEKYFEGETSLSEETRLSDYFTSADVAPHLAQYRPLFGYFAQQREEKPTKEFTFKQKRNPVAWLSVAASLIVLIGLGWFWLKPHQQTQATTDLGTFKDPKIALAETQKALALLSVNVNKGVHGMHYVKAYEHTKDRVFKD
jgi:hypothetical protein